MFGVAFGFGQEAPVDLFQAIEKARIDIETQLSPEGRGTGIVVLNFQDMSSASANTVLSDHVVNNLAGSFTLSKFFRVINRSDLQTVEQEALYQNGGAVSDNQAVFIGNQLGAQYVITGTLQPLAGRYQFSIRAIHVETAQQEAFSMTYVSASDPDIHELTGRAAEERARQEAEAALRTAEAEAQRRAEAEEAARIKAEAEAQRQAREQARAEEAARKKAEAEAQRRAREQARAARPNRFIFGVGGGASFMFSYQALETGLLSDSKTLFPDTNAEYTNTHKIPYVGQFSLGLNKVKGDSGGVRLNGMFSFGEGMTIEIKDTATGTSSGTYTFSYNVFDLGLRFATAPILDEQFFIFTLFVTPYISIPLSDKFESSGSTLKDAKINMLFGPVSNFGALAGFSLGFKAGPGFITADTHFKYDIKDVEIKIANGDPQRLFHRMGIQATLGYEFWF
jgi:TolB-like protein